MHDTMHARCFRVTGGARFGLTMMWCGSNGYLLDQNQIGSKNQLPKTGHGLKKAIIS